ncbi:NADPH-dependent ferric siderophore reductase [Microbacterium resistens]|uniref:NADPH-dependent ferric siderophore reductase n=1 Tax=Microbacterium resistens TaxID=156977 RepID=A0ABU1SAF3_9MICO|nr:hypothetical protein [Microbacterium resistens]MDR6866589.1 NADPH-dependent ferric siderophore reductase [Microbacterium resistens]
MANPHPGYGDHFVLAGVSSDAPFVNRLVAALPEDSYGQVFLEGTGPSRVLGWPGPARLVPFWLRQDLAPAVDGRLPGPGDVLAAALRAWADEWLPEPGHRGVLPFTVWIGGAGHRPVDELCRRLTLSYPGLHLHHPESAAARGE